MVWNSFVFLGSIKLNNMKKIYTLLLLMFFSSYSFSQLIITELADPNDENKARYVEIYNVSSSSIDLTGWIIGRWTNASTAMSSATIDLSSVGVLNPGSFVLIARDAAEFEIAYGFPPDVAASVGGPADSNGDDQIAILDASGVVVDIFGVPGEDGSGTGSGGFEG